jgi:hypothetical protein
LKSQGRCPGLPWAAPLGLKNACVINSWALPRLTWTAPLGLKTRARRPRGALQAGRMLILQGGGRVRNPS